MSQVQKFKSKHLNFAKLKLDFKTTKSIGAILIIKSLCDYKTLIEFLTSSFT